MWFYSIFQKNEVYIDNATEDDIDGKLAGVLTSVGIFCVAIVIIIILSHRKKKYRQLKMSTDSLEMKIHDSNIQDPKLKLAHAQEILL